MPDVTDPANPATPTPRPTRRARLKAWFRRTGERLHPSPPARRGAAIGIAVLLAVISGAMGAAMRPGLGWFLDAVAGALVGIGLMALIAAGFILGLKLLRAIPAYLTIAGFGALGALIVAMAFINIPFPQALFYGVGLGLVEAILGGTIAAFASGRLRTSRTPARVLAGLAVTAGLAVNVALVWWLATPGWQGYEIATYPDTATVEPVQAADPALPGPYEVATLTYGSGNGKRRPEFNKNADLRTDPVDASPFVKGNDGFKAKARQWYWGFDYKHFPLNGTVWYPKGPGPFPLVLIVHGNHTMEEYSDPGYAYLGRHLASRGIILVSVDENFFNGSWAGGLKTENDGRGWLLLKHLEVWRKWNDTKSNPFYHKVDLDRIAIIGHSRGGEAAAIAGCFNRLAYYPDDATVPFDFGFHIRSIVAIAPSDGQYDPADRPTPLADVDYLVLAASNDADVSVFMGSRQWQRTVFDDGGDHFKASVYVYRANHGQFNTVWGRTDFGWPLSLFLNTKPLLPGEVQRRIGKVTITAFLEATLEGRREYREFFRDPRRGRAWLGDDILVSRYEDSSFHRLAGYDEDVDVTTGTAPGSRIEARGLASWREREIPFRGRGSKRNGAVYLGWRGVAKGETAVPASYTVDLPDGAAAAWDIGPGSVLSFAMAMTDEKPEKKDEPEMKAEEKKPAESAGEKKAAAKKAGDQPVPPVVTVELEDAAGHVAKLPLARFAALPPLLEARFTKMPMSVERKHYPKSWETTLQSFEVPVAAFVQAAPLLDPAALHAVRFLLTGPEDGVVVLDEVGFAKGS